MNLDQIKQAIDRGQIVHYANPGYTVIKDNLGRYLIQFYTGDCIGLTWEDGTTLNGSEEFFFIPSK